MQGDGISSIGYKDYPFGASYKVHVQPCILVLGNHMWLNAYTVASGHYIAPLTISSSIGISGGSSSGGGPMS